MKPQPNGYLIKLVRDKTPLIINKTKKPGKLWYQNLTTEHQLKRLLKLKLAEEIGEYLVDDTKEELADVVAVVQALAIQHGTTLQNLINIVNEDPRGGFYQGVGMYGLHKEYDNAKR